MGLKTLYLLTALVVLSYVLAGVALVANKATWEQAMALVTVASTALYTYLRAEPKTPDGGA